MNKKGFVPFVLAGAPLILFLIFGFIITIVVVYVFVKSLPFLLMLAIVAAVIGLIYYLLKTPKKKELTWEDYQGLAKDYCKTHPEDARCRQ